MISFSNGRYMLNYSSYCYNLLTYFFTGIKLIQNPSDMADIKADIEGPGTFTYADRIGLGFS